MSFIDEISKEIPPEQRETVTTALRKVWNNAVDRCADVAERCYYGDDDGFEPMDPSTIASEVRKLKKAE